MSSSESQNVQKRKNRVRTILTAEERKALDMVLRKAKNQHTPLVLRFLREHLLAPQSEDQKRRISRFRETQKVALIDEKNQLRGVITTEDIGENEWVYEMTGKFYLDSEARNRVMLEWGNTHHLYKGFKVGNPPEPICLESWMRETVGKYIRRSCKPNCKLIHFFGTELHFMVVALKPLKKGDEVTLALEKDCTGFKFPLRCAHHQENPTDCPKEKQRLLKKEVKENPGAYVELIESDGEQDGSDSDSEYELVDEDNIKQ